MYGSVQSCNLSGTLGEEDRRRMQKRRQKTVLCSMQIGNRVYAPDGNLGPRTSQTGSDPTRVRTNRVAVTEWYVEGLPYIGTRTNNCDGSNLKEQVRTWRKKTLNSYHTY